MFEGLSALMTAVSLVSPAPDAGDFDKDTGAKAAIAQCAEVKWTQGPEVISADDNLFVGTLEGNCTLTQAAGAGILALDRHLLENIGRQATVHAGPVPELFEGMPAVRFDATFAYKTGRGDQVAIRTDLHIASNLTTHLSFMAYSKTIEADGWAGYMRKFDSGYAVVQIPARKDGYTLRLKNVIQIEQPWYAPTFIFKGEARKGAEAEFKKYRDSLVEDLKKIL